jgi:DNA-binding transcriptional LysR family regulator
VEDRLGELLFARTTRSVSLTEAGTRFLASVAPALADIDKAAEDLSAERGEVTGLLRINTVHVALGMALTPILAKLAWQHPRLTVEVYSDDALVDIVQRGFDAGIRLGEMVQQDMVAMRLTAPFKVILVASPEYLDAKGVPKTIGDLHRHNCIGLRLVGSGGIFDWELTDGKTITAVKTSGTAMVTDSMHALELALAGVGVAYAVEPVARRHIRERRLKWLLPQCSVEYNGLFLYYPRRASLAPKLRAFIEAAKTILRP